MAVISQKDFTTLNNMWSRADASEGEAENVVRMLVKRIKDAGASFRDIRLVPHDGYIPAPEPVQDNSALRYMLVRERTARQDADKRADKAERDLGNWIAAVATQNGEIEALKKLLTERDGQILIKDLRIDELEEGLAETVAERNARVQELEAETDANFHQTLLFKQEMTDRLKALQTERDTLTTTVADLTAHIAELSKKTKKPAKTTLKQWTQLNDLDNGAPLPKRTLTAMRKRGWVDDQGGLTEAGRAELDKDAPPAPKPRASVKEATVKLHQAERAREQTEAKIDHVLMVLETVDDPADACQQAVEYIKRAGPSSHAPFTHHVMH